MLRASSELGALRHQQGCSSESNLVWTPSWSFSPHGGDVWSKTLTKDKCTKQARKDMHLGMTTILPRTERLKIFIRPISGRKCTETRQEARENLNGKISDKNSYWGVPDLLWSSSTKGVILPHTPQPPFCGYVLSVVMSISCYVLLILRNPILCFLWLLTVIISC